MEGINLEGNIVGILFGLVILVGIFLIFREIFNWYWKINKRVNQLADISVELKELREIKEELNNISNKLEKEDNKQDNEYT